MEKENKEKNDKKQEESHREKSRPVDKPDESLTEDDSVAWLLAFVPFGTFTRAFRRAALRKVPKPEEVRDRRLRWYLAISRYYSFLIVQALFVLLRLFLPMPSKETHFVPNLYPVTTTDIWAVCMCVLTISGGVLGVVLTRDLPATENGRRVLGNDCPICYIPLALPLLLATCILQELHPHNRFLVWFFLAGFVLSMVKACGAFGAAMESVTVPRILSILSNRESETQTITLRHWIGLFVLLLTAAIEFYFVLGTLPFLAETYFETLLIALYLGEAHVDAKQGLAYVLQDLDKLYRELIKNPFETVIKLLFVLTVFLGTFVWLVFGLGVLAVAPTLVLVIRRSLAECEFRWVVIMLGWDCFALVLANIALEVFVWR